jgi:hypothetical protein
MSVEIIIGNRMFWGKNVDEQVCHWVLLEPIINGQVKIFFLTGRSEVFDELYCDSQSDAEEGLTMNGFRRWSPLDHSGLPAVPPSAPFIRNVYPEGRIYSSGTAWRLRFH